MTTVPTGLPLGRPIALGAHTAPLDQLADLVEVIDVGVEGADGPGPASPGDGDALLIRVINRGDTIELGLLRIDGHPFDHLIGFTAPDDWWAVGVVANGTARPMADGAAHAPGRDVPGRRVRTTHLVARTGDAASVMRFAGDDPIVQRHPDRHGHPDGHGHPDATRTGTLGAIDDGLRRALGLPSAPPPPTTVELWAVCWLDEVRSLLRTGILDGGHWPSVAACHPLFTLVPELGDDADAAAQAPVRAWAIEHLDRAGRHFAHQVTWQQLLADERQRDRPIHLDLGPGAGAGEALRWLDEGLFSREVLAALPPVGHLLDEIEPALTRPVDRRVRTTLRRWQLPLHGS